jgi:crotonobetainyl-CoA:carnitine CoA-transferase CaiB-like acyl-CoA transferase
MSARANSDADGFLHGVRILELADEVGEYCGKVLAGLGADVVKIEPPDGETTRALGPFYHDERSTGGSLYFWHYNFGKRSVCVDLDSVDGQARFRRLAASADVLLETRPSGYLTARGVGYDDLRELSPSLIHARLTAFGDEGPWGNFKGSDLVHLALGGVMMNCGYDPDPSGRYDTPPIAPQMWHAYHIAGEMMAIAILGALSYKARTGRGQLLTSSVHEAVSKQTETDFPNWVYARAVHRRQTCRHSVPHLNLPAISLTKDGRWMLPYRTYIPHAAGTGIAGNAALLERYGMEDDLKEPQYADQEYLSKPSVRVHVGAVIDRFVGRFLSSREIWREAQELGLAWAPIRRPEENIADEHWKQRETFISVEHPELARSFVEVGAKWYCSEVPWRKGPCAPLLGEHTAELFSSLEPSPRSRSAQAEAGPVPHSEEAVALAGVRVVDLGWLLASAGAGRFLAALGAEVLKVEHASRPDGLRLSPIGICPEGGRAERERATEAIYAQPNGRLNRSGFFMDINAGKRSVSLNLKSERGRELLVELISTADVLIEGFSPGTMDRLGLGYEALKAVNSRLVYVQQSGMGQTGTYGRMRSYGPVAQAFSGLSDMSGLDEPYPPAGIGYSFLDWFGAYNVALAALAGLYRQRSTGQGCWIDSSQVESGTYLAGSSILDFTANGRCWTRFGNRSPWKPAAPHGAYRTRGEDRWVAIACFDDVEWGALARVLNQPAWMDDARFATRDARIAHHEELDRVVDGATQRWDGYELMLELQQAGVPAGVCQTAQDRCDVDPQLRHLGWLVELEQSEIGRWPVKGFPVRLSETPAHIGGVIDRHGPSYGEDNDYVYSSLLNLSPEAIASLQADGVI